MAQPFQTIILASARGGKLLAFCLAKMRRRTNAKRVRDLPITIAKLM